MADEQPDPVAAILKMAPATNGVRGDAWDVYQSAANPDDLAAKLKDVKIPDQVKAALWDLKSGNVVKQPTSTFWDRHPNIKQLAIGTLNTLPGLGAGAGGIVGAAAGIPTVGATSLPMGTAGMMLGAAAGTGARDLIAEASGLEDPSGAWAKGGHMALEGGLAGATEGVTEAVKSPFKTSGEFLDWVTDVIPAKWKPKFLEGTTQFLKDVGREAPGPNLTRPPAAIAPDAPPAPLEDAMEYERRAVQPSKLRFSGADVTRIRGLMQHGLSQSDAIQAVLKGR